MKTYQLHTSKEHYLKIAISKNYQKSNVDLPKVGSIVQIRGSTRHVFLQI
jgi:hypothetical protein